jgi:hypothetical protein
LWEYLLGIIIEQLSNYVVWFFVVFENFALGNVVIFFVESFVYRRGERESLSVWLVDSIAFEFET